MSRSLLTAAFAVVVGVAAFAQAPGGQPPTPAPSARQVAQTDLTGQWVAEITEDWRWRMMTPPKGDYVDVPLNPAGLKVAESWDHARDQAGGEACKAFGAGGLMRQPTRVRITWADENTLKLETDAGQQTRSFHFGPSAQPQPQRTWQGHSVAEWTRLPLPPPPAGMGPARRGGAAGRGGERGGGAPGGGRGGRGGAGAITTQGPPIVGGLKVTTTNLRPGYLRKNGVPYSERAVVTEYYDRSSLFDQDYLHVVTVVEDPAYLTLPFVTSNHFKREADGAKWNPTPCAIDAPVGSAPSPAPRGPTR